MIPASDLNDMPEYLDRIPGGGHQAGAFVSGLLFSAQLLGQREDDSARPAEIAEQVAVLEARHFANEFGAVRAEAGEGVLSGAWLGRLRVIRVRLLLNRVG